MSRTISCTALRLFLVLATACFNLLAADKSPKENSAEADARQDVLAALRAEASGDNEERALLLNKAWLAAPELPEVNWQMARQCVDAEWKPVGQIASETAADAKLAKYREIRDRAVGNVKALREVARWCLRNGWRDRAQLHFAQVLAHPNADPEAKKEAVKELDLHQVGGMWMTREEFAARSAHAKSVEKALAKWAPPLKKLQVVIDGDDFNRRDKAIEEFHQLDDPAMIAALEAFVTEGGDRFQEEAVKRLATFRHYEATVALVKYAVVSPFPLTRGAAIAALKDRLLHESVPILLGGLTSPLNSQFRILWDVRGRIAYDHAVLQEGPTNNLLLRTHQLSLPQVSKEMTTTRNVTTVPRSQPARQNVKTTVSGISPAEAFATERQAVLNQAANEQSAVQLANSQIESANQRTYEALEGATGQQRQRVPSAWWTWWQDYNQYAWPKPVYCFYQGSSHYYSAQQYVHNDVTGTQWAPLPGSGRGSCFVAGTLVRTETGRVPVETIRPGDRVLSQDQDTGELGYKVVLRTTIRLPTRMTRLTAGGEEIIATQGHPFWVNGHGWRMAKELAAGDLLHSLGGAVPVEKVEPAGEDKAYNLVVDDFNTYFVGQAGLLVHDNEFRKPTRAIVPGLVEEVAAK